MRWLKPSLKTSFYALLGHPEPSAGPNSPLDQIRQAMLSLMDEQCQAEHPSLTRRLRYSNDPQALWYARSELMGALAASHGEAVARQKLDAITTLFHGLLPSSFSARPSRLQV